MNIVDQFLKIPIRIYNPSLDSDDYETYKDVHREKLIPEYIVVWGYIKPSDIVDFQEYITKWDDFEEVKANGPSCTYITTRENEFLCAWNLEKFEKAFNKYVDNVVEKATDNFMETIKPIEISADNLTPELFEALEKILDDYKIKQALNQ